MPASSYSNRSPSLVSRLCRSADRRFCFVLLVTFVMTFLIAQTATVHAQEAETTQAMAAGVEAVNAINPTTLVEEGVHSYELEQPKLFWHTNAPCVEKPRAAAIAANAEESASAPVNGPTQFPTPIPLPGNDPVSVSRMATYGSTVRELFESDAARLPGECNPYEIFSNVVADDDFVYWADSTGLVRLSVNANVGDPVTLVSDQIISPGNGGKVELAMGQDAIYALIYLANGNAQIWHYSKQSGQTHGVTTENAPARRLTFDGKYVYWLLGSTLRRGLVDTRNQPLVLVDTIATGVSGYYAEGARRFCVPLNDTITCTLSSTVFVAKGKRVYRYSNDNNTLSDAIYTSDGPNDPITIYDMVTDFSHLYLFESRPYNPTPQGFNIYNQTLIRTGRGSQNNKGILSQTLSKVTEIDTDFLSTDGEYLYWQELDKLLRLPNNAPVLVPDNIRIEQIHVTQGIQSDSNSVELIQGRRTFVRVNAVTENSFAQGVTAFLYRVEPETNAHIGEGLSPLNKDGTHQTVMPITLRYDADGTFFYELPLSWLDDAPLKLKVLVNPYDYPPETTQSDNTAYTKVFYPRPSPRLELDFYVLGYTLDGEYFEPRMHKDILQTFSWLRRAYPLASAPGYWHDPSPGLRTDRHHVGIAGLSEHVDRTHPDCAGLEEKKKSSCTAIFVNSKLAHWRKLAKDRHVYYGLLALNDEFFIRGKGGDGVASGPSGVSCCGDSTAWDDDGAFTDWYTGHEIGHALGRGHPGNQSKYCGHSQSDENYPYLGARLGWGNWGYDPGDGVLGVKRQRMSGIWSDMMSYCVKQWISDYTYKALYASILLNSNGLAAAAAPVAQGDLIAVYGALDTGQNKAYLHVLEKLAADNEPTTPTPGDYAIRLVDKQNQTLAEYAFTPDELDAADEELVPFGEVVAYVEGVQKVEIVALSDNSVWAAAPVSANSPAVDNVSVVENDSPLTGTITLNWTANDADGDALSFDLFYSPNGVDFDIAVSGVTGNSAQVNSYFLAGSASGVFRVQASDGFHTGQADSPSVSIAVKAPEPMILNPGDGESFWWGTLINFMGEAYDVHDGGVSGAALEWRNQDGPLGTGNVLAVDDLPVGENTITLKATNSQGFVAETSMTVYIVDDLELPGAVLGVGPDSVSWHVAADTTDPLTRSLEIWNSDPRVLVWTASIDASWLSLSQTSGETPATLVLSADASGLQTGERLTATLLVTTPAASGVDAQSMSIPLALTMGDVWHADEPTEPDSDPDPSPGPGGDPKDAQDRQVFLPTIRR